MNHHRKNRHKDMQAEPKSGNKNLGSKAILFIALCFQRTSKKLNCKFINREAGKKQCRVTNNTSCKCFRSYFLKRNNLIDFNSVYLTDSILEYLPSGLRIFRATFKSLSVRSEYWISPFW